MNTLREVAEEALRWMEHARLHLTIKERMHPDGLGLYDNAAEALRAALAQPKTELRDQHKAFTHWYFGLRGINEANFNPEYLAWAAWKAALAQPETEAGVSWGGHSVRGDADSIAEVRRLIDFEQARQGAKPATGDDLRVYDAIAANYVNAEPGPVVIGPEWTPCVKLPVTVHVREQRPGEQHVSTREGITPVKPDDLIMRGVAGEEYPIGRELFGRTYRIGANPPRDEWRPASEPPEDLRRRVIAWRAPPQRKSGTWFEALYDDGAWITRDGIAYDVTHWRDVTPPTEGA